MLYLCSTTASGTALESNRGLLFRGYSHPSLSMYVFYRPGHDDERVSRKETSSRRHRSPSTTSPSSSPSRSHSKSPEHRHHYKRKRRSSRSRSPASSDDSYTSDSSPSSSERSSSEGVVGFNWGGERIWSNIFLLLTERRHKRKKVDDRKHKKSSKVNL